MRGVVDIMITDVSYITRPQNEKRDIDVICSECGTAFEAIKNVNGIYYDHFSRATGSREMGQPVCAACSDYQAIGVGNQ